eukprot:9482710-Pyramimonas_sp.AAC.1
MIILVHEATFALPPFDVQTIGFSSFVQYTITTTSLISHVLDTDYSILLLFFAYMSQTFHNHGHTLGTISGI